MSEKTGVGPPDAVNTGGPGAAHWNTGWEGRLRRPGETTIRP